MYVYFNVCLFLQEGSPVCVLRRERVPPCVSVRMCVCVWQGVLMISDSQAD